MRNIVIYHNNCYDGVAAAWAVHQKISDATFIPMNYSDPPPNVKDKAVYVVDFSFKRPVLEQMLNDAEYITILDHHKTAEEELKDISSPKCTIKFDMNKSGAGLAWDYFNPGSPRPLVIDYIEDRDLWRFALPESKAINAWIQSFELGLDVWLKDGPMNDYFEFEKAVEAGHSILRMQQSLVRQICRNAVVKELNPPGLSTFTGPYVETSVLMSEVCDYLVKNFEGGSYPFAFYSYRSKDGKIQYGLRSRSEFDVSAIAKAFGGGGHKNAAGFELDSRI